MILNIHLEYCDDNGERLEQVAKIRKPFNICPIPVFFIPTHEIFRSEVFSPKDFYPEKIVGLLKELSKEEYVGWGQQGFAHYCPECFKEKEKKDPWHENSCLYSKKSVNEQAKIIEKGKNTIEEVLGISPTIYVAPNHQSNNDTKIITERLGYKYFTERGMLNLPAYEENGLIILPERTLGQSGEVFYAHYDLMKDNFESYLDLIKNSEPLENIKVSKKPKFKSTINDQLLIGRKRLRDLKGRL
jgi:hypothetical protein